MSTGSRRVAAAVGRICWWVLTRLSERGVHAYLSTACLHGQHDYCAAMTGHQGAKRPAQCKFCPARCACTGCGHPW